MSMEIKWNGIVLDARDPKALMTFYQDLLGWDLAVETETYCALAHAPGYPGIGAQLVATYQRPVWPPEAGMPDQGAHCDFEVSDLEAAVKKAEALGAVKASEQVIEGIVVMIDPEGHPFCLFPGPPAE